ncbi:MAG: Zn-ribbon domain-containing OB-fold protein [Thermosphaera sp.]
MKITIPPTWRTRLDRYRLRATLCKDCGRTGYPPSELCRFCGSKNIELVELINENARLITWTIIYSAMDGFEEARPTILGILETEKHKARILAPLTDILPEELKSGLEMEPVLRRISEDGESGLINYGIAYRPVLKKIDV